MDVMEEFLRLNAIFNQLICWKTVCYLIFVRVGYCTFERTYLVHKAPGNSGSREGWMYAALLQQVESWFPRTEPVTYKPQWDSFCGCARSALQIENLK